jgi:hypothetical protein
LLVEGYPQRAISAIIPPTVIFEIKGDKSYYMNLPERYNIADVVEEFVKGELVEELKYNTEQQKGRNDLKNVSISKIS